MTGGAMRRKDRQITDFQAMLAVADACACCRLGLADGDAAYIVPMNFGWEARDGALTLYFHCAQEGKKLRLLRARAYASFEMDTGHEFVLRDAACSCTMHYQSVMGRGVVRVVEQPDEKVRALERILAHYTPQRTWTFREEAMREVTVLRLDVTEWSCKIHAAGALLPEQP